MLIVTGPHSGEIRKKCREKIFLKPAFYEANECVRSQKHGRLGVKKLEMLMTPTPMHFYPNFVNPYTTDASDEARSRHDMKILIIANLRTINE
jgi:hypothetical protein